MLSELCKRQSVEHIVQVKNCIAQLGAASYMFSEVKTLLTLFYVIPGSSAMGFLAADLFDRGRHICMGALAVEFGHAAGLRF